jgi:membrane-bound metal-dependent hydrolase YbcI (DUF457 family)
MGRSHAASGAAVWVAGSAALSGIGLAPSAWHVAAGAVVCGAGALLPDIDHPSATVARVAGWPGTLLARGVDRLSDRVYRASATRADVRRRGGHRTLTHTGAFALAAGAVVTALAVLAGTGAVAFVLALLVVLGVRGLAGGRRKVRHGALLAGAVVFAATVWALPRGTGWSWWWVGLAVTVGCLAHLAGDVLTDSGCPVLWPVRLGGRRWYRVAALGWKTGGAERWAVAPACAVVIVGALAALYG